MSTSDPDRSIRRSTVAERLSRVWALWMAGRPSQLALIVLVYVFGVGMATAGPSLTAADSAPIDVRSAQFLETVLAATIVLLPVAVAVH